LPHPLLPVGLVQSKIRAEVPPMLAAVRTNANSYHALRVSTLGEGWMEEVPPPVSNVYRKRYAPVRAPAPAVTTGGSIGGGGAAGGARVGSFARGVGEAMAEGGETGGSGGGMAVRQGSIKGGVGSIGGAGGGARGPGSMGGGGVPGGGEGPSTPFAVMTSGLLRAAYWLIKVISVEPSRNSLIRPCCL
jgi:hypothetical protein